MITGIYAIYITYHVKGLLPGRSAVGVSKIKAGAEQGTALPRLPSPEHGSIKRVIAVMSGKGGVGKSSVTALLAATLSREGHKVGVLDADITGPSIPRMFGIKAVPSSPPMGIMPSTTRTGIRVMSLNLLLPHEDDPVIWRGPLISGAVRQFWTDVVWGDLDYMIVDLPPGTGDAPLTVLQSLPLDGLVVVSSPQDLAFMVVRKAIKMAQALGVPILGLVENMSAFRCPGCGREIPLFGESRAAEVCRSTGIRLLGEMPVDPALSAMADRGEIEAYEVDFLKTIPSLLGVKEVKSS